MGRLKTKTFVGIEKQIDADNGFGWKDENVNIVQKAYKYDFNGNVVKELDALGYESGTGNTVDEKIENGLGTMYTYTPGNSVETVLDVESYKKGLTYSIKYEYDSLGRKTGETTVKGPDFANKYETTKTFKYNDAGYVENVLVDGETIQSNKYDYLGNLLEQKDALLNTIMHEYNSLNLVTQSTYPSDEYIDQNIETFKYDVVGKLVQKKNAMDTVNVFTYDNQGRVLSQTIQKGEGENAKDIITTHFKYDLNGNKRFVEDGNTNITEYIYDELNRVIEERVDNVETATGRFVNHSTRYGYDLNGNKVLTTEVIEGDSTVENTYINVYDPLNRVIEKRNPPTKDCPEGEIIEKLEYNHNNVQVRSYDALNHVTKYEYDLNSRSIKIADAESHATEQGYDLAGNVSCKIDGENNKTKYVYDKYDRLEEVGVYDKDELVNGEPKYIKLSSYTYDLNNNLLTQTDGNRHVTTYDYNAANLVSKKISHGGRVEGQEDDPKKLETYKYYADGSLRTKTDKNSVTETYIYYCHGRLKQKSTDGDNPVNVVFTYDDNGNALTVTNNSEEIIRSYDELNRVKTKTIKKIDTNTVTDIGQFEYEYDIVYSEDGVNYIAETSTDPKLHKTTKVYDRAGRLKYVKNGDINLTSYTEYKYRPNGNLASVIYPGGKLKEVYEYHDNNLLHTLTNYKSDDEIIDIYTYKYDKANNQKQKIENLKGTEKTTEYRYDYLNRLKKVEELSDVKVTEYQYDGAGNRYKEIVTKDGAVTISTYSYNEQNWLSGIITEVDGTQTGTVAYVYDNNGNQTEFTQNGVLTTKFTYDDANQLISSSKKIDLNWNTVNYKYNGEGIRVSKSDGSSLTRYLYEYDKVVLELEDNGDEIARNIYGTNLLMRSVKENDVDQSYYYMYNGHADVTSLVEPSGEIAATYYYDAFGNITESTGDVNNNITYAGYQYDDETKLYYLNARMYDPKVARFLQEDSYRGDTADVLSLNLYTYCVNNPLIYYDPTGHEPWMLRTLVEKANGSVTFNSEDKSVMVTANGITQKYTTDDLMLFNGRYIIDDRLFKLDFGYKLSFGDNLNIRKPSLNIKSEENDIKELNDVDFSVNSLKRIELYNMLPRVFQKNTENFVERYGAVGFMFSMFKVDSLYNLFETGGTMSDRQSYEHGLDPNGACAMGLEYKLNKNGTSSVDVDFMLQQARMEQLKQVMYYKGLQVASNAWNLPKVAEPKFTKFNYEGFENTVYYKGTVNSAPKGTVSGYIPPRVQSRVNVRMEFKGVPPNPKPNTIQKSSGFKYAMSKHGGNGPDNKSQFTLIESEIKEVLQSKNVVKAPVYISETSGEYVRQVNLNFQVGNLPQKIGGNPTNIITVITDFEGNLINTFPGPLSY